LTGYFSGVFGLTEAELIKLRDALLMVFKEPEKRTQICGENAGACAAFDKIITTNDGWLYSFFHEFTHITEAMLSRRNDSGRVPWHLGNRDVSVTDGKYVEIVAENGQRYRLISNVLLNEVYAVFFDLIVRDCLYEVTGMSPATFSGGMSYIKDIQRARMLWNLSQNLGVDERSALMRALLSHDIKQLHDVLVTLNLPSRKGLSYLQAPPIDSIENYDIVSWYKKILIRFCLGNYYWLNYRSSIYIPIYAS
jgi:hypothetical protein